MNFNNFLIGLHSLPLPAKWAWGTVMLATLAAMGLVLYWERRYFRQRDKGESWLNLRICSVLILGLTLAVLIIPAKAISGPLALAYFYGALFTLGPLIWFGGHLLCGRLVRPRFSKAESLFLGASGLLVLFIPPIGMSAAQMSIYMATRHLERSPVPLAAPAPQKPGHPLVHTVAAPQAFNLPGAGTVYTQSLIAPPQVRVERIDQKLGNDWHDAKEVSHPTFCRDGANVHLMWSAREPAPVLSLHWRDIRGDLFKGEFVAQTPDAVQSPTRNFDIAFRVDGIDPVAPIPRARASIAHFVYGGELYFNMLQTPQQGETDDSECVLEGYKRVNAVREGPPQAVALMFYLPGSQPPLRAEISRPAAGVNQ